MSIIRSSHPAARASITHALKRVHLRMYESTTRRIEIKQLDASHSSPDHLCLPASINADHGRESLRRERKGTEYLILIGTKPKPHQASVLKGNVQESALFGNSVTKHFVPNLRHCCYRTALTLKSHFFPCLLITL